MLEKERFGGDPCSDPKVCWCMCRICDSLKDYKCKPRTADDKAVAAYCNKIMDKCKEIK